MWSTPTDPNPKRTLAKSMMCYQIMMSKKEAISLLRFEDLRFSSVMIDYKASHELIVTDISYTY